MVPSLDKSDLYATSVQSRSNGDEFMNTIRLQAFAGTGADGVQRLEWATIINFLRAPEIVNLIRGPTPPQHAIISLQGFAHLNVDGLLWILLLGKFLGGRRNVRLYLEVPSDPKSLSTLRRTGFLDAGVDVLGLINVPLITEPTGMRDAEASSAIERFHAVDESTFAMVAASLRQYFDYGVGSFYELMGLNPRGEDAHLYGGAFHFALFQLCNNIAKHAGEGGFVVAHPMTSGRVRLCLGDIGCGFRESLHRQGIEIADPRAAMKRALLHRFFNLTESREGIFRVIANVHRWGGYFQVLSDGVTCKLRLEPRQVSDDELRGIIEQSGVERGPDFPGVQYLIDLKRPATGTRARQ